MPYTYSRGMKWSPSFSTVYTRRWTSAHRGCVHSTPYRRMPNYYNILILLHYMGIHIVWVFTHNDITTSLHRTHKVRPTSITLAGHTNKNKGCFLYHI